MGSFIVNLSAEKLWVQRHDILCLLKIQTRLLFFSLHKIKMSKQDIPNNFQNESVSSSFKWLSMCILFLGKLKVEQGRFSEGGLGEEGASWDLKAPLVLIKDQKRFSFCEIRNSPTPPLLVIRPHYKQGEAFYDE